MFYDGILKECWKENRILYVRKDYEKDEQYHKKTFNDSDSASYAHNRDINDHYLFEIKKYYCK